VLAAIPILLVASLIAPNSPAPTEDGVSGSYVFDGGLPTDTSPVGIVVWLLVTGFVNGVFLRLSLILPAGAVGEALGLSEAWRRTKGHFIRLFLPLGILIALVPYTFTWITSLISFGGVLDFIAFGVVTLLGIGVLTRLYLLFFKQAADPS
jgi:glycopeptide antibiotics resistance protein